MKDYIIEFTLADGTVEEVKLSTDKLEWSIQQWSRNRHVVKHKILEESNSSQNRKQMLLG